MNKHGILGLFIAVALSACATPREQDPTWQRLNEVDGRVLRIERVINNQSLLELSKRDDSLQGELRALRGQLEQLQNTVDTARNQQRDLFGDLDKRVQALETARTAAPPATAAPGPGYGTATAGSDKDAYQAALNLLKEGKYPEAVSALNQLLETYPQSTMLDNAHYWLGEAYYVLKDYPQALRAFQTVIDRYPGSIKVSDAQLKLGYTLYEMKDYKEARRILQAVADQHANTNAGRLAQQRLAKMSAEGR